ncbi:hypothetical protein [Amycolatopsis nigrescens]|uniref:hypothetical protein n=1 Tax=Amycolatopsis nigrescens TaxID=381445 RepID=UPI00036FB35A|nr:hypothetical protein [Amycolatopsis nigrescens]
MKRRVIVLAMIGVLLGGGVAKASDNLTMTVTATEAVLSMYGEGHTVSATGTLELKPQPVTGVLLPQTRRDYRVERLELRGFSQTLGLVIIRLDESRTQAVSQVSDHSQHTITADLELSTTATGPTPLRTKSPAHLAARPATFPPAGDTYTLCKPLDLLDAAYGPVGRLLTLPLSLTTQ